MSSLIWLRTTMDSEINELKLYFGDDYKLNQYITIHNPTMGDLIEVGEESYFSALHMFTAIPSDFKSFLWDTFEICWMDISDFEFFRFLARKVSLEESRIFFGDLDFTKFEEVKDNTNGNVVLMQPLEIDGETYPLVIDEALYLRLVKVLRTIHSLKPKIEVATTKTVRDILIRLDREDKAKAKKDQNSNLQPIVSSMLNSEGFKYDLKGIRELPYYTFMDSVQRICMIKNATALLQGCYGGWIDSSKVNKSDLDWMKEIKK